MNTLKYLGGYFAMATVNGLPFNDSFTGSLANSTHLKSTGLKSAKELVNTLCTRVEVETFHAERVSGKDKHLIKEARFYFLNNDEPLRLKPAALKDRKYYPEQLFNVDKATGDVTVKENNYFPLMTIDEVINCVIKFYGFLLSFTGENSERNIKTVSYDLVSGNFKSDYGLHFNEEYINLIERAIDEKATACRSEFVDSFLKDFMPGMANKSSIGLSQNMEMISEPWSESELKKPFINMLNCASMEKKDIPYNAYISHDVRLERYIEQYLERNFPIQPPFSQETHGLDAKTWDDFFATGESFAYKNRYINFLKDEIDKRELTLGDAIAIAGA